MMGYTEKVELKMQRLFERLSEKDRRCYAAIEATKLSHGEIDRSATLEDTISLCWQTLPQATRCVKACCGRQITV